LLPRQRPQPSAERVEPDFTPKGVFKNNRDIDFWAGIEEKRGDENETY
jgi:hypothetical protein